MFRIDTFTRMTPNSGQGRQLDLAEVRAILSLTPRVLDAWLRDFPPAWVRLNEGGESWGPFDVMGHLIHGERTDWIPRARKILEHGEDQPFDPFDRFAQFTASQGKELGELLDEFAEARAASLAALDGFRLTPADLDRKGRHPSLGPVTLRNLLATWVAHDFDHMMQIARVLGSQYSDEVGPWRAYLRVISGQQG